MEEQNDLLVTIIEHCKTEIPFALQHLPATIAAPQPNLKFTRWFVFLESIAKQASQRAGEIYRDLPLLLQTFIQAGWDVLDAVNLLENVVEDLPKTSAGLWIGEALINILKTMQAARWDADTQKRILFLIVHRKILGWHVGLAQAITTMDRAQWPVALQADLLESLAERPFPYADLETAINKLQAKGLRPTEQSETLKETRSLSRH